jgi:DNA-binding MarR family transcriptional regulator
MAKRPVSAAREAWECLADLWFGDENNDRFHDACAAADVSPPQLKALLSLRPGAAQPMRALAETWRCDASWVTGIVDGLEERGYVARQPHPTDRRVKVVTITPLGEKAKARALERLHEPPASVLTALTQNEQRTLRDLLRKVRDANSRQ